MVESVFHRMGKQLAIEDLIRKGFRKNQIKTEFPFYLKNGTNSPWKIDVVGHKNNKKIAYEIGVLEAYRKSFILDLGYELIHWDYKYLSKLIYIPGYFLRGRNSKFCEDGDKIFLQNLRYKNKREN